MFENTKEVIYVVVISACLGGDLNLGPLFYDLKKLMKFNSMCAFECVCVRLLFHITTFFWLVCCVNTPYSQLIAHTCSRK